LICGFADKIGQLSPQLIMFNGHAFDLAVCAIHYSFHGRGRFPELAQSCHWAEVPWAAPGSSRATRDWSNNR
jgi:hypothetical protein